MCPEEAAAGMLLRGIEEEERRVILFFAQFEILLFVYLFIVPPCCNGLFGLSGRAENSLCVPIGLCELQGCIWLDIKNNVGEIKTDCPWWIGSFIIMVSVKSKNDSLGFPIISKNAVIPNLFSSVKCFVK